MSESIQHHNLLQSSKMRIFLRNTEKQKKIADFTEFSQTLYSLKGKEEPVLHQNSGKWKTNTRLQRVNNTLKETGKQLNKIDTPPAPMKN